MALLVLFFGLAGCRGEAAPAGGDGLPGRLVVTYDGRMLQVQARGAEQLPTEFDELGSESRVLDELLIERTREPQQLVSRSADGAQMVIFLPGELPGGEDSSVGYVATPDGVWVLYDPRLFGEAPEVTVGGAHAQADRGVAFVQGSHFGQTAVVKTRQSDTEPDWHEPLLALIQDPAFDQEALEAFFDAHPEARTYWELQLLVQDPATTPEQLDEFLAAHPDVAVALAGTPRSSQTLIWSPS